MIDDKGTSYIWKRRIVRGDGTVIYSRPGRGKSTMGVSFAAHITNGWPWPDGACCPEGDVLYIKGEGSDASNPRSGTGGGCAVGVIADARYAAGDFNREHIQCVIESPELIVNRAAKYPSFL